MKLTTLMAGLASASIFNMKATTDPCCVTCPDDGETIMTWSIPLIGGLCGESCMKASDFWKYKIFEPGMKKADNNTATPCLDNGFTQYKETDTHTVPGLLSMVIDMYQKPKADAKTESTDEKIEIAAKHLFNEAMDSISDIMHA